MVMWEVQNSLDKSQVVTVQTTLVTLAKRTVLQAVEQRREYSRADKLTLQLATD